MKKFLIFFITIGVCLVLIITSTRYFLNKNIVSKSKDVEKEWNYLKPEINSYFKLIVELNGSGKYISEDSLDLISKKVDENICTLDFLECQFFINKISLMMTSDTLFFEAFKDTLQLRHRKLNLLASNYNDEVLKYNNFIRGFPVNLYTYKRYKTKEVFDLVYGIENMNPKTKYDEVPDWMLEIEKSKDYK